MNLISSSQIRKKVKPHVGIILALVFVCVLFRTVAAAQETENFPAQKGQAISPLQLPGRLYEKTRILRVKKGTIVHVTFDIPADHLLLEIHVGEGPEDNKPISGRAVQGWRLLHIDKFFEYKSEGHPPTQFVVEAWFRDDEKSGTNQGGQGAAGSVPRGRSSQDHDFFLLPVRYRYFYLAELGEKAFSGAVFYAFSHLHKTAEHKSAQRIINLFTQGKNVREHYLRPDDTCQWGANQNCRDCMLVRHAEGETFNEFFYNSMRGVDNICW